MSETPEQAAARLGVPLIPRLPEFNPVQIVAICGECGHHLKQSETFVCNRRNCPCGSCRFQPRPPFHSI